MLRLARTWILALLAACSLALVPSSAMALGASYDFPSSNSTVVASVGFIDSDEVGFFWSAERGDRVTETFIGAPAIWRVVLRLEVVFNVLNSGAQVDWDLVINGNVVDSFVVQQGFIGPIVRMATFPHIKGPVYTVTIRVTNTVPGGQGSHSLAYAGAFEHSIQLFGVPCSDPRIMAPCWVGKP